MRGIIRRTSIADEVSASLQGSTASSASVELFSGNSDSNSAKEEPSRDEAQDGIYSNRGDSMEQPQQQQQQQQDLPSLEECLYGTKAKKSPFIPDGEESLEDDGDGDGDGDDDDNDIREKNSVDSSREEIAELSFSIDDDELNSRWSQNPDVRADYHDIDLAVLRKLCSHGSGIPEDEGPRGENDGSSSDSDSTVTRTRGTCHRGVAWRVLLEQLPIRDIHATWPDVLPPQRKLYRELVEKYLDDAIDHGRDLRGESHWQQSLRMNNNDNGNGNGNNVQDTSNKQQTLKKSHSDSSLDVTPPPSKFNQRSWSDSKELNSSGHIRATEDIYEVFPPNSKYRTLWKKCGITLNQGHSAAAIRMNRLKIPKQLLSEEAGGSTSHANAIDSKDDDDDDDDDANSNDGSAASCNSNRSQRDDLFEQFRNDAKLLSEIRKDVVRTNPHMRFFLEPSNNLGIRRHAALERILFIWAKLNDNLYVQGMNEIVGTIYYVLAMDPTRSIGKKKIGNKREKHHFWADHAEADTYYLFHSMMTTMEVKDVFVADLDHDSHSGLHARITNIEKLLQKHDPIIFNHLKIKLGLDSSFYAIRWLTTLLSREFRLPDTIRLWDSMLASTHKENFLRFVCATMVMAVRDRLLRGDFGSCIKLLQNYPSGEIGMDELLESSRSLWIYEMQISMACEKGGIPIRKALNVIPPPDGVIMAFGMPGTKTTQPSELISEPTTPVTTNKNVGKFMAGAAKRLWRWGTPKKEIDQADKNTDDKLDEGWDLIDSIIDGKKELVNGSVVESSNITSSTADSTVVAPKQEEPNLDSANFVTPTTTPTSSPSRMWNHNHEDTNITPINIAKNFEDDDNDDNDVEDFANKSEREVASPSFGFWNRLRRSSI